MKKIINNNLKKTSAGFTLAELLTVAGILVIITSLAMGIIMYTLRGGNEATSSIRVSQNANNAFSQASQILQNSSDLVQMEITGVSRDNCFYSATPGVPVTITYILVQGFQNNRSRLECSGNQLVYTPSELDIATGTYVNKPAVQLVNTNEVQIEAGTCMIQCSQVNDFSKPIIDIRFTLREGSGQFQEQQSSAAFRTSITLRNYKGT